MQTAAITIEVDSDTAQIYNTVSLEQRRKLNAIISIHLRRAIGTDRSLRDVMDSISSTALARGMTREILEQILNEK